MIHLFRWIFVVSEWVCRRHGRLVHLEMGKRPKLTDKCCRTNDYTELDLYHTTEIIPHEWANYSFWRVCSYAHTHTFQNETTKMRCIVRCVIVLCNRNPKYDINLNARYMLQLLRITFKLKCMFSKWKSSRTIIVTFSLQHHAMDDDYVCWRSIKLTGSSKNLPKVLLSFSGSVTNFHCEQDELVETYALHANTLDLGRRHMARNLNVGRK